MPGPRRRRHAAAVVGAAFALVLALGLVTLGGARTDHQTQVPAAADRTSQRAPERGVVHRIASSADHLAPHVATLPTAAALALALVVLFLVAAATPQGQAAARVPAVAGRGPPVRLPR